MSSEKGNINRNTESHLPLLLKKKMRIQLNNLKLLFLYSLKLARMESLRQEEAAEVAQKLILLEKEKKTSERRALEASNREEEAQLKLQGYEAMKQVLI